MSKPEKVSTVVFSGYYGMDNFGDDLFAYVCALAANRFWNQTKSRLLSPAIKGLNAEYAVPEVIPRELYSKANSTGRLLRLLVSLQAACRNKLFILGGGSVISSQLSGVRGVIHKSAWLTRVDFAAMGVSIGPFKSSDERERARAFLSDFLFISVRDEASYRIAKEFKLSCPIVQAGDLAGLMPVLLDEQPVSRNGGPVLGVAMCRYESIVGGDAALENRRNQALASAVIDLAKHTGARVEVYSLNNHASVGDDGVSFGLCSKLDNEGVSHTLIRNVDYGVAEVWRRIGQCDFFVSVRLHGAIAAYMNQVPFVLVDYHKKCSDFLDDIGQDEKLRIDSSNSDSETISAIVGRLAKTPEMPSFPVAKYAERALKHFSILPDCQES